MDNLKVNNDEKLLYLQNKIHEAVLECSNRFSLTKEQVSLFYTFLSLVFMRFRDKIDTDIASPARLKASQSAIYNIDKEVTKKMLKNLPMNYTIKDIDNLVPKIVESVCKDFVGGTIIFHSKNNCDTYCKESNDQYLKKLYNSVLTVEEYLRGSNHIPHTTLASKIYNKFHKLDISNTFIDADPNPLAPREIKPLDLKNIDTMQKYFETKINLLTLLTNLSMPCNDSSDGKYHKYCVSEVDVPYFQLVKQATEMHPKNDDDFIRILIDLAHKNYFRKYLPFDEQLTQALVEQKKYKQHSSYKKIFSKKDKQKYTQELINLKNNLKLMKNDRLLNYILKSELENFLQEFSNSTELSIKIKSSKERSKDTGFSACYYTVEINDLVLGELLGISEFRYNLSNEGYAFHNSLKHKSINIKHLFELRDFPPSNSPQAQKSLDFYTEFLNTVSLNVVSGYHISKKDKENLEILKHLVKYAESKLKVKDTIILKNGNKFREVDFFNYISNLIETKGAKYVTIYPAHIVEHNQSISVPQSPLYSLENILKSRVGFSCLANMIRDKYLRIATIEKHDKLLAKSAVRSYSSTLTPKYDLPIDILSAKEAKEDYVPLDVPFHPMGHYHDEDDER